eukprot:Plantae.Rhodophyta-Hildenbrandia_rubra.ctg18294.p3 GENE.Plantae.Rhodophyta-Hildenbrandia_rubra.ctg18294~~Plantae.Rhodophyta-Hildenbrandia_rubra.ctg18294.p3  ORF type:complete len:532 (-),score=144.22 Plantae.Rhodophyta-Hildenbrandia_rubra.ctg18294:6996-8591(-)
MLVLFETPSGHALFKVLDDARVSSAKPGDFESGDKLSSIIKLKAFSKFSDTTSALAAATALVEGKPSKDLRKFLKKQVNDGEMLAVGEQKLGAAIKDKIGVQCVFNSSVSEVMRGIRANLDGLLEGNVGKSEHDRSAMVLGLAHSLSRYKLKFSPDKVDTMIVQAISLLDDLDKEINTYAMRLREWYGWHFPEVSKIITENVAYAAAVDKMGMRSQAKHTDFSGILDEDVEDSMKRAAEISMGTEISEEDMLNIRSLCQQVLTLSEYRGTLFEYLKNRMAAIAPNLTAMVGELVGARLIAHAGSLLSLAKYPASTVQILGAEKALFRALKTKHATPKYGLIFHASVVGQAPMKHKGKISRTLASKCALAIRVDALGDSGEDASVGENGRLVVENRLRMLEGKTEFAISRMNKNDGDKQKRYTPKSGARVFDGGVDMDITPAAAVAGANGGYQTKPETKAEESEPEEEPEANGTLESDKKKTSKKDKKSKKKEKKRHKEKKDRKRKRESEGDAELDKSERKKKRKKSKKSGE